MTQLAGNARTVWQLAGRFSREIIVIGVGLALVLPMGYAAKLRVDAASQLRQGIVLAAPGAVAVGRVQVLAEVPGIVREAPRKGAVVKPGQPVARVENPTLDAAVASARTQLNAARADLTNARTPAPSEEMAELDRAIESAKAALDAALKVADSERTSNKTAAPQRQVSPSSGNLQQKAAQANSGQSNNAHHTATVPASPHHSAAVPASPHHATAASASKTSAAKVPAAGQTVTPGGDTSLTERPSSQVAAARTHLEQAEARKAEAVAATQAEQAAAAHANVQQAQIALSRAEQGLLKASVVAPVSGAVLDVPAGPGAPVKAGQPVVVLSDDADTYVTVRVRDKAAEPVKAGQKAIVTVGDRALEGHVASVSQEAESGWTVVKVALESREFRLTGGESAHVKVLADSP